MEGFLRTVSGAYLATRAERVLEVGCGEGELAAHLVRQRPARFTGVDLSPRIIGEARARYPELGWAVQSASEAHSGMVPHASTSPSITHIT